MLAGCVGFEDATLLLEQPGSPSSLIGSQYSALDEDLKEEDLEVGGRESSRAVSVEPLAPAPGPLQRRKSTSTSHLRGLTRGESVLNLLTQQSIGPPQRTVRFKLENKGMPKRLEGPRVFHPDSRFMRRWRMLCICFLSLSFFQLPILMVRPASTNPPPQAASP
jgi:hypothetical protein